MAKAKDETQFQGGKTSLRVDQLSFDEENPRLATVGGGKSQEDLLRLLWEEMAVDEVALSIAANGFFQEEPLLVIPRTASGDKKFTVVEGNRRLAAVRLLRDSKLRERIGVTDLPTVAPDKAATLEKLPVSIYQNREQLWEYFGFRHINGAKPWDAYSKATYVAKVHDQYGIPIEEIASKIGDRHNTVIRFYRGYVLLEQAEKQADFDKEDRIANRFNFSHLYTAAAQPEFQRFLGITPEGSLKKNPVSKAKLAALREFMTWLYGSKSSNKQAVIRTQNPDLNTLREVLGSPAALSVLRKGFSLERAHEISVGDNQRFREALTAAKEELLQAKATVTTGYSGEPDLLKTADDIIEVSTSIQVEMSTKQKSSARGRN